MLEIEKFSLLSRQREAQLTNPSPGTPHTPLLVPESVRSDAPQWRHSTQRTTRTLHSPSTIVLVTLHVPGHQVLHCCWSHVCSGDAPGSNTPPAGLLNLLTVSQRLCPSSPSQRCSTDWSPAGQTCFRLCGRQHTRGSGEHLLRVPPSVQRPH